MTPTHPNRTRPFIAAGAFATALTGAFTTVFGVSRGVAKNLPLVQFDGSSIRGEPSSASVKLDTLDFCSPLAVIVTEQSPPCPWVCARRNDSGTPRRYK
jgi:hypothetical protein